ncbi:hypothetical protein [Mesorhizobium onobrychidis]|nr:hypothetical protein [Mesorhizobium onobrychidis]
MTRRFAVFQIKTAKFALRQVDRAAAKLLQSALEKMVRGASGTFTKRQKI